MFSFLLKSLQDYFYFVCYIRLMQIKQALMQTTLEWKRIKQKLKLYDWKAKLRSCILELRSQIRK